MENIGILKINELAEKLPGVIRFDKGSGKFPFPAEFLPLLDAVKEEITGKYFHYPQTGGESELRAAIAKWENQSGCEVSPENIVVTHGGMSALFTFFSLATKPGDEVITNHYSFEGFNTLISGLKLKHKRVDLNDLRAVERAINPKTMMIILNSPENPTGKVYKQEEIEGLMQLARSRDIWLLSDEVTNQIVYKGNYWIGPSLKEDNVVVVNSFSKNWFISGIRVGWLATGDKGLADAFANFLSAQSIGVNLFGQLFMTEVLNNINYKKFIKSRLETLESRKNTVREELKKHNIKYLCEVGGGMNYYVDLKNDSSKIVSKLMQEAKVALIPGSLFEGRPSAYARLGFGAVDEAEIVEGIRRIKSL